jgi:hypothetical protein
LVEDASVPFAAGDLARCSLLIEQHFRGSTYSLKSLFHDERQRIVKQIVNSTLADIDVIYAKVYEQHASLVSFLSELQIPMPAILRVSAEFVLGNTLQRCLAADKLDVDRIRCLLEIAKRDAISIAGRSLEPALRQRLEIVLDRWEKNPFDLEKVEELEALVSLIKVPPLHLDLWQAQNIYYERLQVISHEKHVQLSGKWIEHFQKLGKRLGVAVGESWLARASTSIKAVPSPSTSEFVKQASAPSAADAVVMSSHSPQMPAESEMANV